MNDPALDQETQALLIQLLRQTFGARVNLASYQVANQHREYIVIIARLQTPSLTVVVKLAGPHAPYLYPFDRTVMLHRLVASKTTIPMPEVLAVDVSYRRWPWRYLIKTFISGQEWSTIRQQMNQQELQDAYGQIGQAVAELHAISFPAFGEISSEGSVQTQGSYLTMLAGRAQQIIGNPRLATMFLQVLDERAAIFADVDRACLCHEDLHGRNILFQQNAGRWRLATVLDFDKAWAGHHEIDLARLEFWSGMIGEGFWPAYHMLGQLSSSYVQRRPLYQLLWCLEYAQSTPEHLADTRRTCEQLGIRPIESFP